MNEQQQRRKPGRPRKWGEKHEVTMSPEQWAWCLAQDSSSHSAHIRRLVAQAMAAEQQEGDNGEAHGRAA